MNTRWFKLRLWLLADVSLLQDYANRLFDGVETMTHRPRNFAYVERQLAFLEERVQLVRDRLASMKREEEEATQNA